MTEQNRETKIQKIVKVIMPYYMAYPNARMDAESLRIYCMALSHLSIEEIEAAMTKLLRTHKFWPSVSEVCEAAKGLRIYMLAKSGTNSDKLTSAEAWQEVMDNVKTNHLYKPWKFSNPEVERTARQFGMAELCGLEMRDVNTARAQFMRMYDSAVSQNENNQENKEVLSLLGKKRYQALLSQVSMKQIE